MKKIKLKVSYKIGLIYLLALNSSCEKVKDYSCFVTTTYTEESFTSNCPGISPHKKSSVKTEEVIITSTKIEAKNECKRYEDYSSTYGSQGCITYLWTTTIESELID